MPLSARIVRHIRKEFPEDQSETVAQLLEEVIEPITEGNVMFQERVAAAAVICSQGDLDEFFAVLEEVRADWRDVLVAAGLADAQWKQLINEKFGLP
ncbi:hypothetical protein [Streptomyces violens]|uniref:hypothetical protein n=1 Tax=Streptomyces violens TaxID=66377 RepID=UPI0004BFD762|nr:hypothetical protein [Streptomyces violens]